MLGKKQKRGRGRQEREREREIWGERESNKAARENGWVDFDHWSKSTTPANLNGT
jgi:hypothetical protein